MVDYEREFWTSGSKYEDLVMEFENNIEFTHPNRAKGECKYLCGRCCWAASAVKYPTYRGERIV